MEEKLKRIMAAVFGVDVSEINENTSPASLDKWDSLRLLNLVAALEEEFEIEFSNEEIAEMLSFKLVRHLIKEKSGK